MPPPDFKILAEKNCTDPQHPKNIKPSNVFDSRVDYLASLDLLNKCSTETRHIKEFIIKAIFPAIKNKFSFLDVGVGNGQITHSIANHFSSVTLVDPVAESLKKISLPLKNLIKINKSILDVDLSPLSFDFILLSHVLYYIPENKFAPLLQQLYERLNKGGCLLIVISEGLEKKQIIEDFGGHDWGLESLILECCDFTNNIQTYHSTEFLRMANIENLTSAVSIFLDDANVVANAQNLKKYLESFYKENTNTYEIKLLQKYFMIKR
ncbi:class I SAM-dependent methyltransferase [Candidatus Paracaedibacter symbiosus]|uniref:class I SAM-dependent methyltransferase n=1 Tax=Candidatus Paracaedibacter symbiosus TaxID=244582 RepID=UPI000509F10A|nr:class I SAM-dependent methyltransferase [Candidatus Paracaedibacter symbiosus]